MDKAPDTNPTQVGVFFLIFSIIFLIATVNFVKQHEGYEIAFIMLRTSISGAAVSSIYWRLILENERPGVLLNIFVALIFCGAVFWDISETAIAMISFLFFFSAFIAIRWIEKKFTRKTSI